jgi:histone H3/H4
MLSSILMMSLTIATDPSPQAPASVATTVATQARDVTLMVTSQQNSMNMPIDIEAFQREHKEWVEKCRRSSEANQAHIIAIELYLENLQRSLGRRILKEPREHNGPERSPEDIYRAMKKK